MTIYELRLNGNLQFDIIKMLPDNFVEVFTHCLDTADHSYIQQHYQTLLSPANVAAIAPQLNNMQMLFIFCLALKDKIRKRNAKSFMLTPEMVKKDENMAKLDAIQKIADSNPLFAMLSKMPNSSFLMKKSIKHKEINFHTMDGFVFSDKIDEEELERRTIYLENINFIQLLLMSFEHSAINNSQLSLKWARGASKLRDEVIAKLVIQCLLVDGENSQYANFEFFIKYIEANTKCISLQSLSNIIFEATYFVGRQLRSYQETKIRQNQGENIMATICQYLEIFINLKEQGSNLLKSLHQFLKIIDDQDQDAFNQTEFHSRNWKVPSWLGKYSHRILIIMRGSIEKLQNHQQYNEIKIKILKIMKVIIKSSILSDFQGITSENSFEKDRKIVVIIDFLTKFVQQLKQFGCFQDESLFFFQTELISTLTLVFNSFQNQCFNEKKLIIMLLQEYFPSLVSGVQIFIEPGFPHPIPPIVTFMHKLYNRLERQSMIKPFVEPIFIEIIKKLNRSEYKDCFDNCKEEIQVSSQFLQPLVILTQKLMCLKSSYQCKWSLNNFLGFTEDIIESKTNKSHYFIRLCIQMMKSFDKLDQNNVYRQKLYEITLYLFRNIDENIYKFQFIYLLETLLNLLHDEGNYLEFHSFLSMKIKVEENIPKFIQNTLSQLVKILIKEKDEKYIEYVIDILFSTFTLFKEMDVKPLLGQINNSLISNKQHLINFDESMKIKVLKTYFGEVYQIVATLQTSVMKKLIWMNSRIKLINLISVLTIENYESVYQILKKILESSMVTEESENLCFLVDITGFLSADIEFKFKCVMFELIFLELESKPEILNIFNVPNMLQNDDIVNIYINFVNSFLDNWIYLKDFVYYLFPRIEKIIFPLVQFIFQFYSTENVIKISEIYLQVMKIRGLICHLPPLPPKIYHSEDCISRVLISNYFKNIQRAPSGQQLQIIYRNVFERESIAWTFEEKNDNLHIEILLLSEKIDLLPKICDHLEISRTQIFFDYNRLIKTLFIELFNHFVERYSNYCSDFDDSCDEDEVNYVEEFFRNRQEMKKMTRLVSAHYNFDFVAEKELPSYECYESNFLKDARLVLEMEKIVKK